MQEQEILDAKHIEQVDIEQQIAKANRWYKFIIAALLIFDAFMHVIYLKSRPSNTDEFAYQFSYNLSYTFFTYLFGYTIVGCIIALVVAVFPYKGLPYSKKYSRGIHLSMLVLLSVMALLFILLAIKVQFFGFHPPAPPR